MSDAWIVDPRRRRVHRRLQGARPGRDRRATAPAETAGRDGLARADAAGGARRRLDVRERPLTRARRACSGHGCRRRRCRPEGARPRGRRRRRSHCGGGARVLRRSYTRAMDMRALELLELPAILERLAGAAASEPGAALASALSPSADRAAVVRRHALTAEGIGLYDASAEPDLANVSDVRAAAAVAARGSTLEPGALRAIGRSIETALAARTALESSAGVPGLVEIAAAIDPSLSRLEEMLERAVEDDGSDLRDSASSALRRLRRELRGGRARLAERLRALARDPGLREHLQDDFVTERARPARARAAGERTRRSARHRPRQLGDGADALRRALRGRRRVEPAPGGRERRARGGRPDPARALEGRRRARADARLAGRGDRGDRPRARVRHALTTVAGRSGATRGRRGPCAARGIRCSILRRRSRSTSSSATCAAW